MKNQLNPAGMYRDKLNIPDELKKELANKGLAYKWINRTEFKKNFGFHRSDWKPYQISQSKTASKNGLHGLDADGMFSRGDLILAVKPVEEQRQHRQMIKHLNQLHQGYNKQQADELGDMAKGHSVRTKIDDGFDGPDED